MNSHTAIHIWKVVELHFGLCGDWAEYYGATVYFTSGWFIYGHHVGCEDWRTHEKHR